MGTGEQQVEYQPVTGEVGARVSNQLWRKRQGLEFVGPFPGYCDLRLWVLF